MASLVARQLQAGAAAPWARRSQSAPRPEMVSTRYVPQLRVGQASWPAQRDPVCIRDPATWRTAAAAEGKALATVEFEDVSVEEVMNPHPVLLQASLSMKEAVHKLLDANVAGAPVVNQAGQLVGVLSEADVIWKGAGAPEDHFLIPPVFIGAFDAFVYLRDNRKVEEETHKILARTVGDAMVGKEKVISIKPSAAMSDAAHLMLHHDVNLLPVVEADMKVVGVVTRHDVLRGIYASKNPLL